MEHVALRLDCVGDRRVDDHGGGEDVVGEERVVEQRGVLPESKGAAFWTSETG